MTESKQDRKSIMKKIFVKQSEDENACEMTEEPLTPKGAIFCNPRMDAYILSILGLSKQVDVVSFKHALQLTLVKHKPFSSTLKQGKWGSYVWMHNEDIDIDKHIIVPDLDSRYTQRKDFVEDYTASLASETLDLSRPLWQVHILNYRSPEAEASLVFKIHHCIGDCVSLMSLFMEHTRKATESDSMPTVQNAARRTNKVSWKRRVNLFQTIWTLLYIIWLTMKDIFNHMATILWMKDSQLFREGIPTRQKRLAHVTIDLQDIGVVKNAVNCTVNDVVVGMLSAGFVQYIDHHRESISKDCIVDKDLSKFRLRALIAVNMRPLPGLHRLEYMLNNPKQARWGNGFGAWLLPIPLNEHKDPLNYCKVAKSNLLKKKESMEATLSFFLSDIVSHLYGVKILMYLVYRLCLNTTMVFSNVLGSAEEVHILGNTVTHIVTTVSWLPQPVVVHFQSYAKKAKLVVMAAENIMPDPIQLCMECARALKQMKEAALRSS